VSSVISLTELRFTKVEPEIKRQLSPAGSSCRCNQILMSSSTIRDKYIGSTPDISWLEVTDQVLWRLIDGGWDAPFTPHVTNTQKSKLTRKHEVFVDERDPITFAIERSFLRLFFTKNLISILVEAINLQLHALFKRHQELKVALCGCCQCSKQKEARRQK
jgi:hypothetical protein